MGKRGERRRALDPLGLGNLSPYSEYSQWSSERDINLTLRLWVFICLWEMRSAAQMTVPILQIPLTVGVHTKHTGTHTTHSRASATFPSLCVPGIFSSGVWTVALDGLDWRSSRSNVGSWKLQIKNTPWLFGQKQHKPILDKWVSFSMSHSLQTCACVCECVCVRVSKTWWYDFIDSFKLLSWSLFSFLFKG